MIIPKLKRMKVSSEQEIVNWLAKHSDQEQDFMFVTCGKKSRDKYLSHEQVNSVLIKHGWVSGLSYTLKGNLVGHVVTRA